MAQARIVVRDEVLERGEQLLKTTKLGSLTELFNVLICRYGNHLVHVTIKKGRKLCGDREVTWSKILGVLDKAFCKNFQS